MDDKNTGSDRARKRAIRKRMAETSEPYSVAAARMEELRAVRPAGPAPRCPRCDDGTVIIDVQLGCNSCGAVWKSGVDAATEYAETFLGLTWYAVHHDGAEDPVENCPECGEDAIAWDEFQHSRDRYVALCFCCTATFDARCGICNVPMVAGDSAACTRCWREVIDRP